MSPNDLSILIATRNRPSSLTRTLDELRARGFGKHTLLVYDDASEDSAAIERIVSCWPGVSLLRGETRSGQAKGRNELMRLCPSKYALFLDDDSWPEDYVALVSALEVARNEAISVATFQCRSLGDGKLSQPTGRRRGPILGFLGGASIIHVPVVLCMNGYREWFFYGYEEPELAFRLWINKFKMEYFPDVVVAHNHLEIPGENRDHREYDYLYARNAVLVSSLNMPLWFGLMHGFGRSLRRSLYIRRNLRSKTLGTVAGLWMTFRRYSERTPCSFSKALEWCRLKK